MNGDERKIEIFQPFGAAFELMKRILFQPFDFTKWLVIGFAAFLSGSWGSGFNFRFPNGNWNFRSVSHHNTPMPDSLPSWFFPFIVVIGLLVLVIVFALMWIQARGRFIFTDCVVKNRAEIVLPWREYRREGNRFFLFSLAVGLLALVMMVAMFLLIALPMGLFAGGKVAGGFGLVAVLLFVFVVLIWLAFAIFFGVVTQFMVPVMYHRRCLAREAFFVVAKLVRSRPGPFVLFVLFGIVLVLALILVSTVATCLTCCLAGLPYVSSVVLLPAFVWLMAFKLLFLRQFGPEYDVWASVDPLAPALPPAPPSAPPSTTPSAP